MENSLNLDAIDAFVFDFDGVMTNNLVHLDQDGKEFVTCSRADGLAFDVLRKLKKPAYILSTEQNPIVSARAKKLKIPAFQGIENKENGIMNLVNSEGFNLKKIFYTGNDLNDYKVMQLCGNTACPADSHKSIKKIASFVLKTNGGEGVVREILEHILKLDFIKILDFN
jgi:3-deoxy-D-manno-octulosonate 8-phosphate phosphatase (KDO 8-P phosphatase)